MITFGVNAGVEGVVKGVVLVVGNEDTASFFQRDVVALETYVHKSSLYTMYIHV